MDWKDISRRVMDGGEIARAEALRMLQASDDELLSIVDAAGFRVESVSKSQHAMQDDRAKGNGQ